MVIPHRRPQSPLLPQITLSSSSLSSNEECSGCQVLRARIDTLTEEVDRLQNEIQQIIANVPSNIAVQSLENRVHRIERLNRGVSVTVVD